jgi:branched-chain amino acid transport system ATP-binding protein
MLLEVKDLKVDYDQLQILKGVSLELQKGDIVVLIGPNGAGKSTTLRTISGLKKSSSGEIWFRGERIDMALPQVIVNKGLSHVPEGRRLFPDMTVYENLNLGAFIRKDKKGVLVDMEGIYKNFPILGKRTHQTAGSLSGGEQQMLTIARSLMAKPILMLMDEPTLGLSPLMVGRIAEIITGINKKGTSILLVEQNARMALSIAQRAFVMEGGTIVLKGVPEHLSNDVRVKRAYLGG